MPNTFTLIQAVTVGAGGVSNITFNSIPQTYTDLKVVLSTRTSQAGVVDNIFIRFNGSSTNYIYRFLFGSGTTVGTSSGTDSVTSLVNGNGSTSNTFSNAEWYIPNYTSSNNKSYMADDVTENNGSAAYQELWAHLWSDTSAITSIAFTSSSSSNFMQYSTAYLYGIVNS